ncbi:MAG TPA: hypothetical protein VIQ00_00090, partial [Chitinophagaceae bacterium]
MNTQTQNVNSVVNQDIKSKFVAREVYCNVNSLVEYCLKQGYEDSDSPINSDELENYYSYPEYFGTYAKFEGGSEDKRNEEIERLKEMVENNEVDFNKLGLMEEDIEKLENLESEPQEVYEWWAVSRYLYDKLEEKGHVVCYCGSCYVWGRTTTGQAILLDGVISEICSDMEILEGQ